MAKNDLFRKDWLDIVFENRNKAYGAYKLRKNSSYTTIMSLVTGIFLFSAVFVIPSVISNLFANEETGMVDVVYDVPITPKDIEEELFIPKDEPKVEIPVEKVETVLTKVKEVKYTELEVTHASNNTEEPANVDDFINANPGANNVDANENGEISIEKKVTDNPADVVKPGDAREGVKVEDNKVYLGVSYKAEPYETMTKFSANFVSKFRSPDIEAGTQEIKVIMSFIVEKDGRLTDIKVLRDPGYGAGQEAIRVLKTMPKWKPALNNDKPVRSQFTLPITIRIQ